MKKNIITLAILISCYPTVKADYTAKIFLNDAGIRFVGNPSNVGGNENNNDWIAGDPIETVVSETNLNLNCSSWSPDFVNTGFSNLQSANCDVLTVINIQNTERNTETNEVRNVGSVSTVERTENKAVQRYYSPQTVVTTDQDSIACTSWSPEPSTVIEGKTFKQTGGGCTALVTRTTNYRDSNTYEIIDSSTTTAREPIMTTQRRDSVGTKPNPWVCDFKMGNQEDYYSEIKTTLKNGTLRWETEVLRSMEGVITFFGTYSLSQVAAKTVPSTLTTGTYSDVATETTGNVYEYKSGSFISANETTGIGTEIRTEYYQLCKRAK